MPRTPKHTTLPEVRPFKRGVEECGLSYGTMRDAHFRGELAVIKIGRAWYIEMAELARFIEAHTRRIAD